MSHTAQHTSCCGSQTSCVSKPRLQPLANRILVRRLEKPQTVGSILLPDSAKKEQEQAEVIAVGPGKLDKNGQLIPMPVQVGQRILMEKYSGQKVDLGDEDECIILRDSDVIAIIED